MTAKSVKYATDTARIYFNVLEIFIKYAPNSRMKYPGGSEHSNPPTKKETRPNKRTLKQKETKNTHRSTTRQALERCKALPGPYGLICELALSPVGEGGGGEGLVRVGHGDHVVHPEV